MNPLKSSIILSMATRNQKQLVGILRHPQPSLPIKYMGVPIARRDLRVVDCEALSEQLRNYLAHWKKKDTTLWEPCAASQLVSLRKITLFVPRLKVISNNT